MDKDLLSIQQVRELMALSKGAQKKYSDQFVFEKIDAEINKIINEKN